jgi:hypothetical protein
MLISNLYNVPYAHVLPRHRVKPLHMVMVVMGWGLVAVLVLMINTANPVVDLR